MYTLKYVSTLLGEIATVFDNAVDNRRASIINVSAYVGTDCYIVIVPNSTITLTQEQMLDTYRHHIEMNPTVKSPLIITEHSSVSFQLRVRNSGYFGELSVNVIAVIVDEVSRQFGKCYYFSVGNVFSIVGETGGVYFRTDIPEITPL